MLPQNVILVKEPSVVALQKEFANLDAKILQDKASNGRDEVLVYYSGHADEKGLRLGEETYAWTLEATVWTEILKKYPESNNLESSLVTRENILKQPKKFTELI